MGIVLAGEVTELVAFVHDVVVHDVVDASDLASPEAAALSAEVVVVVADDAAVDSAGAPSAVPLCLPLGAPLGVVASLLRRHYSQALYFSLF